MYSCCGFLLVFVASLACTIYSEQFVLVIALLSSNYSLYCKQPSKAASAGRINAVQMGIGVNNSLLFSDRFHHYDRKCVSALLSACAETRAPLDVSGMNGKRILCQL